MKKKNMSKEELAEYKAYREARKFAREQSAKLKGKREVFVRSRKK